MGLNIGEGLFSADPEIYGRRPVVPQYDPQSSYAKTIASNIQLQPQAQKLAQLTNAGNQASLDALYQGIFPQYKSLMGDVQGNIANRVHGVMSPDVVRNIQNQGAIWGQNSGVGASSPQVDFLNLRNYGLTDMALQRQGESDLQNYLGFARSNLMPSPLDIRDYSINPSAALSEGFNRDWLANQIAASPDPAKRGQFDSKMAILGMVLSAYGGGAGYQNTYKPNYGGGGGGNIGGGVGGGNNWWTNSYGGDTQNNYSPGYNTEGYLNQFSVDGQMPG